MYMNLWDETFVKKKKNWMHYAITLYTNIYMNIVKAGEMLVIAVFCQLNSIKKCLASLGHSHLFLFSISMSVGFEILNMWKISIAVQTWWTYGSKTTIVWNIVRI